MKRWLLLTAFVCGPVYADVDEAYETFETYETYETYEEEIIPPGEAPRSCTDIHGTTIASQWCYWCRKWWDFYEYSSCGQCVGRRGYKPVCY